MLDLLTGSCLEKLFDIRDETIGMVMTSPPYCNRLDYTRTYALEIAYLGYGDEINDLRQTMLSCTVENKSKIESLKALYLSKGKEKRFCIFKRTFRITEAPQPDIGEG